MSNCALLMSKYKFMKRFILFFSFADKHTQRERESEKTKLISAECSADWFIIKPNWVRFIGQFICCYSRYANDRQNKIVFFFHFRTSTTQKFIYSCMLQLKTTVSCKALSINWPFTIILALLRMWDNNNHLSITNIYIFTAHPTNVNNLFWF